jgi:Domain of unknown function (DUF1744)
MYVYTQRYLLVKPWLLDRLDSARYSHIPVANLGADARCTMADVTYGRLLQVDVSAQHTQKQLHT